MEIKEVYEQYFNAVYGYLCTLTGGVRLGGRTGTGNLLPCKADFGEGAEKR